MVGRFRLVVVAANSASTLAEVRLACVYLSDELWFPPVAEAEEIGLLAIGGDLSPQRLLLAYSLGIFPWYNQGEPILWWSPNPRCVLFPEQLHVSKSLRKLMRRTDIRVTFDQTFDAVIESCRAARSAQGTWITPEMGRAYCELHRLGFAHSVECWQHGQLVGGLYGVSIGRCFFGESMFSLVSNASKLALATLSQQLILAGFRLIDCQQTSDHLLSLGATEISRENFCHHLAAGLLEDGKQLRSNFPVTPMTEDLFSEYSH